MGRKKPILGTTRKGSRLRKTCKMLPLEEALKRFIVDLLTAGRCYHRVNGSCLCPFGLSLSRVMSHPSEEDMKSIFTKVQNFLKSEDGPTAVEYAIMLALIVIVCLTAIQAIGTNAASAFNDIATDLNTVRSKSGPLL